MVEALDVKAFVPARDFSISQAFYTQLGFRENWANDNLAEFECSGSRFLLQKFYEKEFADNLMMQLLVADADSWWSSIEATGLIEAFPGVRARAPELQAWGQKVLYLWDPSGVLWHIAEPIS